jgi:hypothetical protein
VVLKGLNGNRSSFLLECITSNDEIECLCPSVMIMSCGNKETEAGQWYVFLNKFQEPGISHFNILYYTLNSGMAK